MSEFCFYLISWEQIDGFWYLISWEQIDGFWWNYVYVVLRLTFTDLFNSVMALDWYYNFIFFISIFRNNEWILIKLCLCIDIIWSMLWLIHIFFLNFSTELWPLIDFRIMFMLNILWNNWWIWPNLVDTLIFFLYQQKEALWRGIM